METPYRPRPNGLALRRDVLVALMAERGWDRARLSRETGIHASGVTRLLTGETAPTDDSVGRLMRAFPALNVTHLFSTPATQNADAATGNAA